MLRTVLMAGVPGVSGEEQVRFQPPDEAWLASVSQLRVNALNVYLFDVRERRDLRSNEWSSGSGSQGPTRTPDPVRVDCHYLVSAWSPATVTPATEPTLDEHKLLYDAMAVLLRSMPLVPATIYPRDSQAFKDLDPLIAESSLPVEVVPPEGFLKLAEFWGSMGTGIRWKPAIWLIVTVPVGLRTEVSGPMVTTRIIEFRPGSDPATAEVFVQIAGTVTRADEALEHAVVSIRRDDVLLQSVDTGADGRFTFAGLRPVPHVLQVSAPGVPSHSVAIDVPDPHGRYDIAVP
ncbi:hypothetical protein GCM10022235_00510 [Kribbella ginsengisoli]|uniref:Pvc16 N-terminal domain-containing protein n=1 Tax=Kribbella ginsengisoli TaxID=363865 RepID=A0ABP6VMU7_9ACTN